MKILPVNNYQNSPNRSNQPNFQARPLIIEEVFHSALTILPGNMGKVHRSYSCLAGLETHWVGILKKGIDICNYSDDFQIFRQARNLSEAEGLETRLKQAVDIALKTDGPPIRLNPDYNIMP